VESTIPRKAFTKWVVEMTLLVQQVMDANQALEPLTSSQRSKISRKEASMLLRLLAIQPRTINKFSRKVKAKEMLARLEFPHKIRILPWM